MCSERARARSVAATTSPTAHCAVDAAPRRADSVGWWSCSLPRLRRSGRLAWAGYRARAARTNQPDPARRSRSWVPAGCTCTPIVRCPLFVVRSTTPPDELASAASFVRGETCRFEASLGRWWRRTPLLAFARSTQSTVVSGPLSVQPSAGGMTSRDTCAFESNEICACSRGCACGGGRPRANKRRPGARDRAGILRVWGGVGRPIDTPKEPTHGAAGAEPTSILCASALG